MAKQLVLGIFPSIESAESAVKNLLEGASDYSEMHVGSIGILVLDESGKLKEIKRGQRMGGRGATIGLAVAALTPIGLIAGLAGGAALGHFRQQGPKFSADDQARLIGKLEGGKAALGVLVQAAQAELMADVMNGLGGTVESHDVDISDEELAAAEAALPEQADS
jgi:uncharacterized membrane protein